jgi:RimJ/RimL family protein N-acetyltransferase
MRTGQPVVVCAGPLGTASIIDPDTLRAKPVDPAAMAACAAERERVALGTPDAAEVTHRNYARRGYAMFALVERESGQVVGFCGLVHPGGQPEAELKYALRPASRGRGRATEAAAGVLGYGASVLGIKRVIATTAPANTASQRVLRKAGMQRAEPRRNDDGSLTQIFAWSSSSGENAA